MTSCKQAATGAALVILALLSGIGPLRAQHIIDLGSLTSGGTSKAWAMNSRVDSFGGPKVVGGAQTSVSHVGAFVWSAPTGMHPLPDLGGTESASLGINNSGAIVGWSRLLSGARHAFLYRGGVMTDLGTLGGLESVAYDINDHGQVVGAAQDSQGRWRAFRWTKGVKRALGTFGGASSFAYGINNRGHVVGKAQNSKGEYRAFQWNGTGALISLGTLPGGTTSEAQDINDRGEVVGTSTVTGGSQRAFFRSPSTGLRNLEALASGGQSRGLGINGRGMVVGTAQINQQGAWHAFFFPDASNPASRMFDLNLEPYVQGQGWVLVEAWDIANHLDALTICGKGVNPEGTESAFKSSSAEAKTRPIPTVEFPTGPGQPIAGGAAITATVRVKDETGATWSMPYDTVFNVETSPTSVATAPPTVTVDANESVAELSLQTYAVTASTPVTVTLKYSEMIVWTGELTVHPPVKSISLTAITGGNSGGYRVYLNGKPNVNIDVTLESSNEVLKFSNGDTRQVVTVLANADYAVFNITTTEVPSDTTVTITYGYGGVTKTKAVTVRPISVASFTLSPTSVTGGSGTSTGTVTLERAVPEGFDPIVVTLTSSKPGVAAGPATLTFAPTESTKTFTITTTAQTSMQTAMFTAKANGRWKTAKLTVNP